MPSEPAVKAPPRRLAGTQARPAARAATAGTKRAGNKRSPNDDSSETLSERAYRQIEQMLVTLEIAPGTLMSELELSRRLGISRTPIGEALSRLARSGLVTVLQRRGFMATEVSVTNQLRLLELRCEIARLVARLAALRALPAQRAALLDIAREFVAAAKSGDELAYLKADQDFHQLVAQCTQNDFAAQALEALDPQARRFWFAHRHHSGTELPVIARLHAQMAEAIERGDAQQAAAASDALSECLEKLTRSTIDPIAQAVRTG